MSCQQLRSTNHGRVGSPAISEGRSLAGVAQKWNADVARVVGSVKDPGSIALKQCGSCRGEGDGDAPSLGIFDLTDVPLLHVDWLQDDFHDDLRAASYYQALEALTIDCSYSKGRQRINAQPGVGDGPEPQPPYH